MSWSVSVGILGIPPLPSTHRQVCSSMPLPTTPQHSQNLCLVWGLALNILSTSMFCFPYFRIFGSHCIHGIPPRLAFWKAAQGVKCHFVYFLRRSETCNCLGSCFPSSNLSLRTCFLSGSHWHERKCCKNATKYTLNSILSSSTKHRFLCIFWFVWQQLK